MKKLLTFLAVLACCVGALATIMPECYADPIADIDITQDITDTVKAIDNVKDCQVECFGRYVFVALRTKGVTTKTDADKLNQMVINTVKEQYPRIEQVYVSTSIKAFKALEKFDKQDAIKQLLQLFDVDVSTLPKPTRPVAPKGDEKRIPLPYITNEQAQ